LVARSFGHAVTRGQDDVGGLDHGGDLGADNQAELLDGLHRDRGHQAGAARVQFDVGDGLAGVDARDAGRDLVPGAQPHECRSFVWMLRRSIVLRPYATHGAKGGSQSVTRAIRPGGDTGGIQTRAIA
jgi:hypothetical protein